MKTKNIFSTTLLTLALGLSLNSCMDLDPKDSMGDNLVWTTADNFELFANQFYSWTRDFGGYSADYQNALADGVHSDLRSDIICVSTANVYSTGTNTIPTTDANFKTLYKRIYYTNLLLQKGADRTDINQPMGEAYWFRAYLYFELVQIYGNAQLVLEPLDIDSNELQGSRDDRGKVIDQCVSDLNKAAELLPDSPTEDGRLCKAAAWALLSRVALYEGTWQKFHTGGGNNTDRSKSLLQIAVTNAQKVIDTKKYEIFKDSKLVNDFINNNNQSYRYMFILEDADCNPAKLQKKDNKEYILAHRHRLGDKTSMNLTQGYLGGTAAFVTRKMANLFLCSDGLPIDKSAKFQGYASVTSEFQNRDIRMDNDMLYKDETHWKSNAYYRTSWNSDDASTSKSADIRSNTGYQNEKWAAEREVANYYESYDYPVIRYAEVLLNYTEALYELNDAITDEDGTGSLKYLNLVRQRVNPDMPKLTSKLVRDNQLDMRTEIRRERTVELYLEGFRIDDLKRWKTAGTEMPEDQLGVQITGTEFATYWSKQSLPLNGQGCILMHGGRTWADKNYLYPLPSDQLQLNPNLTQNPDWK